MCCELPPWDRSQPLFRRRKCPAEGFLSKCFVPLLSATTKNSPSGTRGCHHSTSSPSEQVFSMALPRKAPLSTPGTPVLEDFPQNDDEKERLQRRRSRVFDLQFSTDSPHLLASPSSRWVGAGLPCCGGHLDVGYVGLHHHNTLWILGLDFEKIQCRWSLPELFVFCFSFPLGMLMFQLRFLSLQTHRLLSITPPVSNCLLKMWVSAGLISEDFAAWSERKSRLLDSVENAWSVIVHFYSLATLLSAGVFSVVLLFLIDLWCPSDKLPAPCGVSRGSTLGVNGVVLELDSR